VTWGTLNKTSTITLNEEPLLSEDVKKKSGASITLSIKVQPKTKPRSCSPQIILPYPVLG
jgi:hypothetical protein